MLRPAAPRRMLVLASVLTVLALASTGCDAGHPPAAVVAGHRISSDTVFADLKAEAAAARKSGSAGASSNPLANPGGSGEGTYTTAATARALNGRILYTLYGEGLARDGVSVTAADKTAAKAKLCVDPTTGQPTTDGSCPALDSYSTSYKAYQLALEARLQAFSRTISGRAFDVVRRTSPASLKQVCVDAVHVLDATVVAQVGRAVAGGSSLADAATAAGSTKADPTVQQGCLFLSDLPDAAGDAAGTVLEFTPQAGVTYAALITKFQTATRQSFAAQPPSSDPKVAAILQRVVNESVANAHVSVDPRFGSWDAKNLAVVAPVAPKLAPTKAKATTTTTAPAGR